MKSKYGYTTEFKGLGKQLNHVHTAEVVRGLLFWKSGLSPTSHHSRAFFLMNANCKVRGIIQDGKGESLQK